MSASQTKSPLRSIERGADPIDKGELEVGYNADFEKSWARFGHVFHFIMVAFVAAALGGLLGHGPFSHASAKAPGGMPSVDYEPVARYGTPTTLTFHLSNPYASTRAVKIELSFTSVQPLGLQRSNPLPVATEATQRGIAMTFEIPPEQSDAQVELVAQPSTTGWVDLSARVGDSDLTWHQFIAP